MNTQWIHDVLHYDPHLSAVSFLVNSIHLVVLVQKSMRTSSTNIILLAIAVSNLAYMTYPIIDALKDIYNSMKPCILPDSYAYVIFSWISYTVQDDVRRCEAFLSLAMASIRTFVLKYPMKYDAATSVSFGSKTCLILFLLSSIISSIHFLTTQINPVNYLKLRCKKGFSNDTSAIMYVLEPSTLGMWNQSLLTRVHMVLDAFFSKIFPAVLFPIQTLLLIFQIRKVKSKSRNKMFSDPNQNKNSATTKLVFLNTIVYVTSTLPSGIFYVLHSYDIAWLVEVNLADFVFALRFLTSLMTLTHFPICLAMSTQYRSTVLGLLRFKKESGTTVENF
ncbi:Protein CBG07869 [Caenorhabditis briggsae]|uniref:Protein CBG07869 n=1 Tax=Caenorhabditis briggsae TaxID=6238 RepID=A8X5B3_CAEBR|nr:Protein CBG07869 [Caenorhabditis briggsae]CAP27812.2 Protein CBG07869 [Caenorhabditis briggsae]